MGGEECGETVLDEEDSGMRRRGAGRQGKRSRREDPILDGVNGSKRLNH